MDVFICCGNVLTIGELSDGIIWAVLLDEKDHASLVYIKEKTKEQGAMTAEKEEIILGTFQAIGNMKQWIMEFNRSNDQYEIKVKEYNKEDAETGFENKIRSGCIRKDPIESVVISAKSRHKEGLWEFVKFLLSEQCQDGMVKTDGSEIGFPVKISSLEKQLKVYQDDQEAVLAVREMLYSTDKLLVVEAEEPMIAIIEEETGAFFN